VLDPGFGQSWGIDVGWWWLAGEEAGAAAAAVAGDVAATALICWAGTSRRVCSRQEGLWLRD
jgi:hypothetical protein